MNEQKFDLRIHNFFHIFKFIEMFTEKQNAKSFLEGKNMFGLGVDIFNGYGL